MSYPRHLRDSHVTMQEGSVLTLAGTNGKDFGAGYARAVADGAMNALIRLEGHQAAATFGFALADRLVAGVRGPTEFKLPMAAPPEPETVASVAPAAPANRFVRFGRWLIDDDAKVPFPFVVIGVFFGLWLGSWL